MITRRILLPFQGEGEKKAFRIQVSLGGISDDGIILSKQPVSVNPGAGERNGCGIREEKLTTHLQPLMREKR
jgi:hypothetical protein